MNKKILSLLIAASMVAAFSSCKKDTEDDLDTGGGGSSNVTGLYINEVVINTDWIELYNSTDQSIDLSGFILQDSKGASEEWVIPAGTTIPANGFVVFDGEKVQFEFGLSSDGDDAILLDADGNQIDKISVPAEKDGNAYARIPDGGSVWEKVTPTKGASNGSGDDNPTGIDYTKLSINEINGTGSDAAKYVEIFNSSSQAISLEGVTLHYNNESPDEFKLTWTGQADDEVAAGSYFVVEGAKSDYPSMSTGLSANNGFVKVQMQDPSGVEIETYSKPLDINEGYAAIVDKAHEKIDGVWYYTTTAGTKGAANAPFAAGFVAFGNEANVAEEPVDSDPAVDYSVLKINEVDGNGKFVEIYNTGEEAISLAGLTLVKNEEAELWWTGEDALTIPAGGYYSISEEATIPGTGFGDGGISPKKNVKFELKDGADVIDFFVRSTTIELDESCTPDYGEGTPYSFGRVPNATGDFKLTIPTCNAANGGSQGDIVTQ